MQTNKDSLTNKNSLMKIGDATSKFGISHRSLHYWESAGILKSSRAENDYRYYDEENLLKIKQIVLLRKLRLSIPSIQEIFASDELSKVIAVFTGHLDETKKETEQLNALGVVLKQLLNMLSDRQNIDSVCKYLDTAHDIETEELKAALKTVLAEPVKELAVEAPPEPVLDMTGVDLSLELMNGRDVPEVTEVVRRCYSNTEDIDKLLDYFNFARDFNMPGCRWWYKIMRRGACIGAVNLAFTGMASMLVRNIAYMEPDNNIYIFELLKQKYPDVLCWLMFDAGDEISEYSYPDRESKKARFCGDNEFTFYTDANRRNQFIKMMKPHDEVYNGSKYRFALGLDEANNLSDMSWLRCAMGNADWYDNYMGGWRITDCFFGDALIYDTGLERSKFYKNYMAGCDFRYNNLENSTFTGGNLKNCKIMACDISGLTIDGVNVMDALEFYKMNRSP
ncbi:MAG: MerR family transcriptional regulator [Oscillospiraceae bacterium]|nr:MerR family transcriptional regulator [Oscillospiraceae bacterium]